MCVICVSKKGVRQPNYMEFKNMFDNNPHGAGYMVVRNGKVHISKGYMYFEDFINEMKNENFGINDLVVYHFRISTQAGVNAEMTHPFPLAHSIKACKSLDLKCDCAVAHNGIIRFCSDYSNNNYSDTVEFITKYLVNIIRCPVDLQNESIKTMVSEMTNSKFAILDKNDNLMLIGDFIENEGLLFSNASYNYTRKITYQNVKSQNKAYKNLQLKM